MKTTFAQIEQTLEFLTYADLISEEQVAEADMVKVVALIERFKKDVDTTFSLEKDAVEELKIGDIYKHNSKVCYVEINSDARDNGWDDVTVTALTKGLMHERYCAYEGDKYNFRKDDFLEHWTRVERIHNL